MTDQGAPPSLDFGNPFANMGGQQRMGGQQQQQQQQQRKAAPQYLEYNTKGRPWMERLFYNTGVAALVGTFGGGAFGVVEGLNKAPRNTARVRINSMLNYSGRRGSKAGNALGSVALLFTMMEGVGEQIELEHLIDSAGVPTVVAPMAAAAATGLIYKGTKGPRVMAVYAAAGCVAALGMELASTAFVEQRIM